MSNQLKIKNRLITTPLIEIVNQIRDECGHLLLYDVKEKNDNVVVSCPYHKGGQERRPSASIFTGESDKTPYGWFHCFTCGESVGFDEFVAHCLSMELDEAQTWLCDNYGEILLESEIEFPDFDIESKKAPTYLDPQILINYNYYHPYMWKRKLSKEVVDKYFIGYNKLRNTVTFPVWDEYNHLVMITERNVETKQFYIPEDAEKPVYLLNFALTENYPYIAICESQINALTCLTYGIPAVALFGTGSQHQMDILNKCSYTNFVLLFDGDSAGRKGAERFKHNIKRSAMVTDITMPFGKDVNDLNKEEVDQLLWNNGIFWRIPTNIEKNS